MDTVDIVLPPVMFSGITSVNESSENILAQYTKAKIQFLCVAFILVSAFSSAFQISAYPQHLIDILICVFLCICLYQIEQVLVTVIGPLPSDELVIHIKMECVLLILKKIYMLIMYGVLYNSLCKFVHRVLACSPNTVYTVDLYNELFYIFFHLLSLIYTNH